MASTKIFFTGATGYVGGAVLTRLLEHPQASTFDITVLVRNAEKAKLLEKNGVKAVVGSHDDFATVEKLSSEADYVIATADADNLTAAKAVLSGMKLRHESTKQIPVLIHTSGTAVLIDNALGEYTYDTIYDDANPDQIETLAPTQLHRNIDLLIVDADKAGYVKTYIVLPSTIYGLGSGKLVEQGIVNPHSIQVPGLIKIALDRGQAAVVGQGKNLWPHVHIDEIADLYIVLFDAIRAGKPVGHGREGFYFGENGEYTSYEVNEAIGVALSKRGIGSATPTSLTKAEVEKYKAELLGSNSRAKGNRSRSIGWKPTKTTEDLLASIDSEVEALLAKHKPA